MAVILGLCVAATYGAADFMGGLASRRSPAPTIVLLSQSVGLAGSIVVALLVGWDAVASRDAVLAVGAGIGALVGVTALYQGLAVGRMGLVAPVSAVTAALLPIAWGLATGEDPSAFALAGAALAVVAVGVVARAPDPEPHRGTRAGLALALLAGVGFAMSFICFGETNEASGFVPVLLARCVSVPVLLGALAATRGRAVLPAPGDRPVAVGTGLLDITANVVLLAAVRGEMLSLVAPVASLYPAGTVLLARVVLDEPIGRQRLAGLGLSIVALAFIAVP